MNDVGADPPRGGGDLERGVSAGQQGPGGPDAANRRAVPLEQLDLVPVAS